MPLYEYQCENCGQTFELLQKFSDEPIATHQACGGPVHRLLSAPALQFKGSGFYITDYAKSGSGSSSSSSNGGGKAESSDKKDSGSTSSTSTNKPAASTSSSSSETKSS